MSWACGTFTCLDAWLCGAETLLSDRCGAQKYVQKMLPGGGVCSQVMPAKDKRTCWLVHSWHEPDECPGVTRFRGLQTEAPGILSLPQK